jgi:hypothetical protein
MLPSLALRLTLVSTYGIPAIIWLVKNLVWYKNGVPEFGEKMKEMGKREAEKKGGGVSGKEGGREGETRTISQG